MNFTATILGILFIGIGLSAIFFKKYPNQNVSLEALQRKNKNTTINVKKMCIIDGTFYSICGLLFLSFGIFFKAIKQSTPLFTGSIVLLIVLLAAYYPIKNKFSIEK